MEGKEQNSNFFERNEQEVSRLMCKILAGMTLVFPVFFLLSSLRVFSITIPELAKVTPIGLVCTLSPAILNKFGVSTKFIKNYSIVAVAFFIALMAGNAHIGIYITYVLALALSCLYFDKKFTIRTAVIGYVFLVTAVFIRSGNVVLYNGDTRMKWFIAYTMGYTMEYVAMSAVFISLAGRARRLLENLYNTEMVKEILAQCGDASGKLSHLLGNLKTMIRNTVDNNHRIHEEADKTRQGCENSLAHVEETNASVQNMSANMYQIHRQMESMSEISKDSCEKTENYIQVMNRSVHSMQQIDKSSVIVKEKIKQVGNCSCEIETFASTIAGIAGQTNILALNASIEAARAGEQGKGFAVVAAQVGILAKECREATESITEKIEQMNENVKEAHLSVEENGELVSEGIREIANAKEEAGKLLGLQKESRQRVKEVEEDLSSNVEYQEAVAGMAEGLDEITNQSLEQVKTIGQAIQEQVKLVENMQDAFAEVQKISDQLLQISRQEN